MTTQIGPEINSKEVTVITGNHELESALKNRVFNEGGHCISSYLDLSASKTIGENLIQDSSKAPNFDEIMGMLSLEACLNKYPGQLSVLEKRKVAFAKTILAGSRHVFFECPAEKLSAEELEDLVCQLRRCCALTDASCVLFEYDDSEGMRKGAEKYEPVYESQPQRLPIDKYYCN